MENEKTQVRRRVKRIHLIISGDVQGVGFRALIIRVAKEHNLVGWVTNRPDGMVEIVAEGTRKDLEELIKRCQEGPLLAVVKHVDVRWQKATGEFISFEVIY